MCFPVEVILDTQPILDRLSKMIFTKLSQRSAEKIEE